MRHLGQMRVVQSIKSVEATNCSCTNTAKVLRYMRIHQIRHRAVVGSSSNRQGAINQCLLGYSLHIVCFSSSLSPVIVHGSCEVLNSSTDPMVSLSFTPVSLFTTNSNNCLFLFAVLHLRRQPDSTSVPSFCSGVSDSFMVSRIAILQTCNVVAVQKQRLASFQHLHNFSL